MDLVMFHSGEKFPNYLGDTFKQIRMFNPELNIHFLVDSKFLQNKVFIDYNIIVVNKDLYYTDKIHELNLLYKRKANDFWTITTTRLVYIENYIEKKDLTNVYHFENDVLLYRSLKDFHTLFTVKYPYLAITAGSKYKYMTGFMFIKNYIAISLMTRFFIDLLSTYGKEKIIRKYNLGMIHEMGLMGIYGIERGYIFITKLPTLPNSPNFEDFNSIFDPAAWGQFVGGTQNEGPGAKPTDHDISQVLIKHPEYNVIWVKDIEGRKIPFFKMGDEHIRINNLHIHSKNLHLYLS